MGILFKAKTNEAYNIKIMSEILHNTLKNVPLSITRDTMSSKVIDNNKRLLIDINLNAVHFTSYQLNGPDLLFGMNVAHFYKIISSLKKKDTITFLVEDQSPNELQIIVTPREKDHVEISKISIQNIQSLHIEIPDTYKHPVHISSSKFQKMCKDMLNIGKEVHVYGNSDFAIFHCQTPGIYEKQISFGEEQTEPIDLESPVITHYYFETDQLVRISKIASLCNTLYLYLANHSPLMIKTNVGTLGTIALYIKSIKQ